MFPNMRLMITAVVASVITLSCGFGIFAALRINHEPIGRLPAASAPLRLITDNAVTASAPVTAAEPLEHRLQNGEPRNTGDTTAMAYSAMPPKAAAEEQTGVVSAPISAEVPAAAGDDSSVSSSVASAPAPSPTSTPLVSAAASPPLAQRTASSDAELKSTIATADVTTAVAPLSAEPATLAAASVTIVEPVVSPSPAPAPVMREAGIARADAVKEFARIPLPIPRQSAKEPGRTRITDKTRRVRRAVPVAVDWTQPHFLTAPPEQQMPVRVVRRAAFGAAPAAPANSAVSGPFVLPFGH
jgi:hypothetical protein